MNEFDKIKDFNSEINLNPIKEDAPFYKEEEDFSMPFSPMDTQQKAPSSSRIHLFIFIIFILILGTFLLGVLIFKDNDEKNTKKIVIQNSNTPVKTSPSPQQQSGQIIPNQDKMIYEKIRTEDVDVKVETMFPEIEKPLPPVIESETKVREDTDFVPLKDIEPINPLNTEELKNKDMFPSKIITKDDTSVQKTESLPLEKAPAVSISKNYWTVQLMSSKEKSKVENAWTRIYAKNKDVLFGLKYTILSVDIPRKGTFYRLRVGSFKTRSEASEICKKLKKTGQDCIPARRD